MYFLSHSHAVLFAGVSRIVLKFLSFCLFYIYVIPIHGVFICAYIWIVDVDILSKRRIYTQRSTCCTIHNTFVACYGSSIVVVVVIHFSTSSMPSSSCVSACHFLNNSQHAEGSISVSFLHVQLYCGPETVKTYAVVSNLLIYFDVI